MLIKKVEKIEEKYLELLKLIDSGEYRIATDGDKYGFNGWLGIYTFELKNNEGILTAMLYKDYLRVQISFQKDVKEEIVDKVYNLIKDIMEKEKKPCDIWLNNDNTNLVQTLIKRFNIPIKDVYMSRELMYLKEPLQLDNTPLRVVPYTKEILMDTLYLLEDSFVKIASPNDFINNKEEYDQKFSNTEKSRFSGFMLNDELIGMYFHHDGEIEYIAVKSTYQNKRYGKIILHHALNTVKEDSSNNPYLYCIDENEDALRFYLREGFEIKAHAARL